MNPAHVLIDPAFPELKRSVLEHTGLDYYANRDEDLATRMSRRIEARGANSARDYLGILKQEPVEMDCLVGELTIGETYFFRQPDQFDLLRTTVFPDLLERNQERKRLRIWSAGCATGAEPYSIAILLSLDFEAALAGWDVSILATDINVEFVAQAREASFSNWVLRETPQNIRECCFLQEAKRWKLSSEIRNRVTFRYHNLAGSARPTTDPRPFDLIFCRNVLIYFSQQTMRHVAKNLYDWMAPGGWLIVGHAEPNAEIFAQFEAVPGPAGTAYRKAAAGEVHSRAAVAPQTKPVNSSWDGFPPVDLPPLPAPIRQEPRPPHPAPLQPLTVGDIRLLADSGRWNAALLEADKLVADQPARCARAVYPRPHPRTLRRQRRCAHRVAKGNLPRP